MIHGFFREGIVAQALKEKVISVNEINLRDFAKDKHQKTDDRQIGGGPGMVMKIDPIYHCLESLVGTERLEERIKFGRKPISKINNRKLIIALDARGKRFTQSLARKISTFREITILCGRYQGFDQRILNNLTDLNLRIGDTITNGGESLSTALIESVTRLIPGVLGNKDSTKNETFNGGSHPLYTYPKEFLGMKVPDILFSGDHKEIDKFRSKNVTR